MSNKNSEQDNQRKQIGELREKRTQKERVTNNKYDEETRKINNERADQTRRPDRNKH